MKKLFIPLLIALLLLQVSSAQNVGIGTITPMALLDVNGDALVNGLKIGRGGGNDASNTVTGISCLGANTSGVRNSAFGVGAMSANTSGHYNAAYGGYSLLNNTSGYKNAAFGDDAMNANTSGSGNTSIGHASMYNSTTGSFNAALGQLSGLNNVTGSYNLCLGSLSDVGAGDLVNASAIGSNAFVGASNSMVLGSIQGVNGATENTKVGIGTTVPSATLDVSGTFNASAWKTASVSANGYAEMGGVLVQWGAVDYSSNSPVTVTFPRAFANVFSVTATVDAGNNSGSGVNIPVKVLNISSITFQVAGTAVFNGDTSSQVRWIAIGN